MIKLSGVRYRVINIENLIIPEGYTCIIGENGSGKSTLLRLLSGMEIPDKGNILADETNIRLINTGYIPEFPDRNIIFNDVYEEIASPLRFSYTNPDKIGEEICKTAEMIGISRLISRKTKELSGGEKAFVSLAVALVNRPQILVLDEPDSHMDFETSDNFQKFLKNSVIRHIIHCTQDMNTAENADFLIFMEKGEVKFSGKPDKVFENLTKTPFLPLSRRLAGIV